jgi:D-alanyl-D-alanine carboxypeptidase
MRLKAPIIAVTAAAILAGGGAAWALTAAGQARPAASGHPTATVTRARPRPSPTRPAGPVLEAAGQPAKVKAKGAVLADAATGQVLWSRDVSTQRPMASVTKVMTALLVLESGGLNRQIRVPKAAQSSPGSTAVNPRGCIPGMC